MNKLKKALKESIESLNWFDDTVKEFTSIIFEVCSDTGTPTLKTQFITNNDKPDYINFGILLDQDKRGITFFCEGYTKKYIEVESFEKLFPDFKVDDYKLLSIQDNGIGFPYSLKLKTSPIMTVFTSSGRTLKV